MSYCYKWAKTLICEFLKLETGLCDVKLTLNWEHLDLPLKCTKVSQIHKYTKIPQILNYTKVPPHILKCRKYGKVPPHILKYTKVPQTSMTFSSETMATEKNKFGFRPGSRQQHECCESVLNAEKVWKCRHSAEYVLIANYRYCDITLISCPI